MLNCIYRAVVRNSGEEITYRNSKGKTVTFSPHPSDKKDASALYSVVNKYFTGKSPNITPQEQVKLRADLANNQPSERWRISDSAFIRLDFVLKTFSDKHSEGGENITPNEVYQMYEMFHKWSTYK